MTSAQHLAFETADLAALDARIASNRRDFDARFALARQLFEAHELVGLVRLVDRARSAHHGRDAGAVEQARLGAEGHERGALLAAVRDAIYERVMTDCWNEDLQAIGTEGDAE